MALALFPSLLEAQADYFQQDLQYEISVELDDQNHFLRGFEKINYKNNSPDTLRKLYLHLWPNAYSSDKTAFAKQQLENGSTDFHFAKPEDRGFIDSLSFQINGEPTWWKQWEDHPDVVELWLPAPLPPGDSLLFETPFRIKIPSSFSRFGHVDQQYQVTQWYPKPAVYDRDGWHPMPYLDQGEFYSEFGTFDVYIKVPRNYVVGATGDLPENDPERRWLRRREDLSRKMLELPEEEAVFKQEFSEKDFKVLHYHQERVHDFAWFADKEYYVLSDTVHLPYSGRVVDCVAMFGKRDREVWTECPRYIAQSIHDYSLWNGDYPYQHATAVDGALSAGAGMEYPNITVLAGRSPEGLEQVTMHEVGHNWFYGMLASNERQHPWMDEGLNSYMEDRYWQERHEGKSNLFSEKTQSALGVDLSNGGMAKKAYEFAAFEGYDQPIELHSADYLYSNYGIIVYMKTAQAFKYLEGYLGRERIDACFRDYFEKWKFKHPQPEDLQESFEMSAGEDLAWFFEGLIQGTDKIDFRISKTEGGLVTVRNHTGIPLPAHVVGLDKDGNVVGDAWTKPFEGEAVVDLGTAGYHKAIVNPEDFIPDWREGNNIRRNKGIAERARGVQLNLGYSFADAEKFDINVIPVIGGNTTDGFMAGLRIFHGLVPRQPFSFHLMPMYGFRSSRLTGSAGFKYQWLPKKAFRKIELKLNGSSFSNFVQSKQALVFHPVIKNPRSGTHHKFSIESLVLGNREEGQVSPSDWYLPVFGRGVWEVDGKSFSKEMHARVELGGNVPDKVLRLGGEFSCKRNFGKANKASFQWRVFAGGLLSEGEAAPIFQWGLSGSGDPFAENILFDRAGTGSWLGNQLLSDHGGFSTLEAARFDRLLTAGNVVLRNRFGLAAFGDIAYGRSFNSDGFYYAGGLRISLFKDALRVNFPLCGSVYDGLPDSFRSLGQNITFTFEPLKQLRKTGWNVIDF